MHPASPPSAPPIAVDSPPLLLTFQLSSASRTRRRYHLSLLSSRTEALPPSTAYATPLPLPPACASAPPPLLHLVCRGRVVSSAPLSYARLLRASRSGAALHLSFPPAALDVRVHAARDAPALATRALRVALASRGVLNAFCARAAPRVEATAAVRRRDGSWNAFARAGGARGDVGGEVLLRCEEDEDVAVRFEGVAVRGAARHVWGEAVCAMSGLVDGRRLPLTRNGLVTGVVVVWEAVHGKVETSVVVEVFLDGARGRGKLP